MTQGRIIHEAGEAEASGPGPGLPGIGLQRKFSTTLGAEISTLCLTKTPHTPYISNNSAKKWYNFNNFRCTESQENFTSDYQQVAHLTWIMSIAALPCEIQLIWCCLPDSRQCTTHQPALVRATHLLLGKTIINSVGWIAEKTQRVDMDTYFVMYWWSKTFAS